MKNNKSYEFSNENKTILYTETNEECSKIKHSNTPLRKENFMDEEKILEEEIKMVLSYRIQYSIMK